jgi:hypothetical protein
VAGPSNAPAAYRAGAGETCGHVIWTAMRGIEAMYPVRVQPLALLARV